MKLKYIAEKLECTIVGDANMEIKDVKYANDANANDIAVAFSEKEIFHTKAFAVLTEPKIIITSKTLLYCSYNNINATLVKLATLFVQAGIYTDYALPVNYRLTPNGAMLGSHITIGENTSIAPFTTVGNNVVIGKNCVIEPNVFIGSDTHIGNDVTIHAGARVGVNSLFHYVENGENKHFCGVGRLFVEDGVKIGCNTIIQRGTLVDTFIGARSIIGNLVEIAHDVKIGADCLIVSQAGVAGNVCIGNNVKIFGQVGIANNVEIKDNAVVLAKSRVIKDVKSGDVVSGMYGRSHSQELKLQAQIRKKIREE